MPYTRTMSNRPDIAATMRMNEKNNSRDDNGIEASTNSHHSNEMEDLQRKKRRQIFGECALIEIIHLHDCLRGAIRALELDVTTLETQLKECVSKTDMRSTTSDDRSSRNSAASLERRIAGRFKVIWSVFKSHSQAEDEYIWPALKTKTQNQRPSSSSTCESPTNNPSSANEQNGKKDTHAAAQIEQAEYEEDHADEEKMFREMDTILIKLRQVLRDETTRSKIIDSIDLLSTKTHRLSQHLLSHLEKEETQCLPLVVKHLTNEEIHNLVGDIMGKRSADLIVQIMTMAVQNLDCDEREEMVKYMKESMAGTFFDRWLSMTGWSGGSQHEATTTSTSNNPETRSSTSDARKRSADSSSSDEAAKRRKEEEQAGVESQAHPNTVTSQTELEKLIRVVATNSSLTQEQRNTTIQGLRDSVWKSNQQHRRLSENNELSRSTLVSTGMPIREPQERSMAQSPAHVLLPDPRRVTPPTKYFRKNKAGDIECVSMLSVSSDIVERHEIPLFTPSELAPTYHDGAAGAVLGCPHYARACKLRHPVSGRLYTCRLCCEQARERSTTEQDEPLDRYSVSEVLCMVCNALQPASQGCVNNDCQSFGRPFAKYFCGICNLYDDSCRPVFHCPYCNACRRGHGLGEDYRHCMRCNACVSLSDKVHQCIPQKLQGNCPICRESLFQSTEQLRGLKCGHVMHLSCFTDYRRSQAYTCPLCKKSVEDMSDYFSLLDAAVRMQPMPVYHLNTMSNIYCQDCEKHGQTRYHLVGLKCTNCNSYNTRELNRVQVDSTM